jgi:hypothetical protein
VTLARDKAHANPSKAFFVRMLTRDISLDDCILDLVDNSIDGAWEQSDQEPTELLQDNALADYQITIELSEDKFTIRDNCGGISLDDAADYAFTFGRREDQEPDGYSVGVYGIGMKRAVFKIGEDIRIRSTYEEEDHLESFVVPIDVREWMKPNIDETAKAGEAVGPSWDFDIEEASALPEAGVEIEIEALLPDVATRLGDPTYARTLRKTLGRDYMVPLMRGLKITVNDVDVVGSSVIFRENEDFLPMRDSYMDGEVKVEILAGMVSMPPDSTEPDENEKKSDDPSGWYVLCNGRVVLAADTTTLTGWGDNLPKWHRQYAGFAGVVLFSAEKSALLPMTTTKRSVDNSSGVYRRALSRMFEPTRTWVSYTNARKADLENAKAKEVAAQLRDIVTIQRRPAVQVPTLRVPSTREKVGNVHFTMPLKRLNALAAGFGDPNLTYRDIGIRSFEYAYDELVEDDA